MFAESLWTIAFAQNARSAVNLEDRTAMVSMGWYSPRSKSKDFRHFWIIKLAITWQTQT